jgi:Rieske Fe-S protein
MSPQYERLNDWIDQLQANKHPEIPPLDDPAEAELFIEASQWMGQRPGADEPDPAFLADLRGRLFGEAAPPAGQDMAGEAPAPPPPAPLPRSAPPTRSAALPQTQQAAEPAADDRVIKPGVLMERRLSRRNLLTAMGTMAAGLIGGLGLESWLSREEVVAAKSEAAEARAQLELLRRTGGVEVPPGSLGDSQGKWFAVASVEDVKIGEAIPVTMGGVKGMLLRTAEREFNAMSGVCTHLGCDLGWDTNTHLFVCGCHGSSFDTTGQPLTGPALYMGPVRNLPAFSWKIQEGIVYVLA